MDKVYIIRKIAAFRYYYSIPDDISAVLLLDISDAFVRGIEF